jgi:hypothetical protein
MYHVANWYPNAGFTWSTSQFRHKNVDLLGTVLRGVYIADISTQVVDYSLYMFWGRELRSFMGERMNVV